MKKILLKKRSIRTGESFEYQTDTIKGFWDNWLKADVLDRRKFIQEELLKAPVWDELIKKLDIEEGVKQYCISSLLNSYFEDLEQVINNG